jgi:hypothetical protein
MLDFLKQFFNRNFVSFYELPGHPNARHHPYCTPLLQQGQRVGSLLRPLEELIANGDSQEERLPGQNPDFLLDLKEAGDVVGPRLLERGGLDLSGLGKSLTHVN